MEDNIPTEKENPIKSKKLSFYCSEELAELFSALNKAQAVMSNAKMDSNNPFYKSKYADFSSVIKATRKPLTDNGLVVTQFTREKEGKVFLFTRLGHISGQWIDSFVSINPLKPDIQSLGSHLTYLRRYSYAAIVGVVASGEDDDGEQAMDRKTIDGMANFERQ